MVICTGILRHRFFCFLFFVLFFDNEQSEGVTSRKKFKLLSKSQNFGKCVSVMVSLATSYYLKTFPMRSVVILINTIFRLCSEICQTLRQLHNPVNQYFPNDQCGTLEDHTQVKDPFKAHGGPMDCSVTKYRKLIDLVSYSTWQPITKQLPLVEFRCSIKA